MATIETFGVDAAMVATYLPGYVVTASSPVTTTQITTIIGHVAAVECAYLTSVGIVPAELVALTSSQGYALMQRLIALGAAHDVATSWEGSFRVPEGAQERRRQYETTRDEYRARLASLGDARPTGDGAPGITSTHVSMATRIAAANKSLPLASRLAMRREV